MAMGPVRHDSLDEDGAGAPLSEINVTPMVDVMLVLLIIFMVAAPLMTVGVPVRLPTTAAARVSEPRKPVIVSIDAQGQPFLGEEPLTPATMQSRLRAAAAGNADQTVLVRGDRTVPYGRIMEVMGEVGAAGFAKVSLIAQVPSGGSAGAAP